MQLLKEYGPSFVFSSSSSRMQFPRTSIREIKILKMLDHENIVRLHEIVQSFGTLELMIEKCCFRMSRR